MYIFKRELVTANVTPKSVSSALKENPNLRKILNGGYNLEELDLCLEIHKKIKEIDEKIRDITEAAYFPKSQGLSDMPKGGGSNLNAVDVYIIRREELIEKRKAQHDLISKNWGNAYRTMKRKGIEAEDSELMRFRFYYGYPWKKCAAKMREIYGKHWNINRVFRVYRKVLTICTK